MQKILLLRFCWVTAYIPVLEPYCPPRVISAIKKQKLSTLMLNPPKTRSHQPPISIGGPHRPFGSLSVWMATFICLLLITAARSATPNCATITNTNSTATPQWVDWCMCKAGYIWNSTGLKCVACTTIVGTASSGSVQGSCACTTGKIWKGVTLSCVLPTTVDCSATPNNGNNTSTAIKSCNCVAGYTWNTFFLRC